METQISNATFYIALAYGFSVAALITYFAFLVVNRYRLRLMLASVLNPGVDKEA